MYDYITQVLGYTSNVNQNSTILSIAGFLLVMLVVVCLDIVINSLFSFFNIRERRKK